MKDQEKQILAEKIALLLSENESESGDAKFFRESLEKINQRLDKIESNLTDQTQNSKLKTQNFSTHPSQERFLNIAQIADEIIENLQNEKACPYEPTGKPCDNCSMCNSRGF
jgi:hypothetical protein